MMLQSNSNIETGDLNCTLKEECKQMDICEVRDFRNSKQGQRWKLKYIAILMAFVLNGMCTSILGPTLLDVAEYFGTDLKGISAVMTINFVGFSVGAAVEGVMYDHFQPEIQFCITTVLQSVLIAVAPWTRNLAAYTVILAIRGAAVMYLDAAGQSYMIRIMQGKKFRDSAVQSVHLIWSIASTVGPFIIQPFLSLEPISDNSTININISFSSNFTPSSSSFASNGSESNQFRDVSKVPYAYLTVGLIGLALSIPFLFLYITGPKSCLRKSLPKEKSDNFEVTDKKKGFTLLILFFLYFWFFFLVYVEAGFFTLVSAWAVKSLNWSNRNGALLASTVYGFHGLGRVLSIFQSMKFSPRQMLILSMSITTLGIVCLFSFYQYHNAIVWIAVAASGLGLSWAYPTGILWAARHIPITGKAAAVFTFGGSTSSVVCPILTGFLMQEYSYMWFLYLMLIGASLDIIMFIILEVFVKCHNKIKQRRIQHE